MCNGNEGKEITVQEAKEFIANYRNSSKPKAVKAEFFGKEKLNKILDQEQCVGIRFYFGKHNYGELNIVAVGCDKDGEDLYEGIILEMGEPCPPHCASLSPLK